MADKRITVYVLKSNDRRFLRLEWVEPDTGRRRGKSTKTDDPDEAERQRADKEYELNHGLHSEPSKMPWETFRDLYEDEKLAGLRANSRKKAAWVFDAFEEKAHPRTLGDVGERMLSKYATALRSEGRTPATIQGHLAYIRAALRWAADQKLIPAAPKVVMPKVPKKRNIRKIVLEQFERLLEKAPNVHWRLFMLVAWYTGMRRCEILDLTWDNEKMPRVDFRERKVWLPAAYNKSDEDQWLPLHPELIDALQAHPGEKTGFLFPFRHVPMEVSRKFSRLAKSANLKITLHDLRRSFGSRYASVVPAPVLQRLMRHADIKTTLEYYTVVDDVLEEAIRKA